MQLLSVITVLVLTWTCTINSFLVQPMLWKEHGETCSSDSEPPCNAAKFLSCIDGKCSCSSQQEMIFDSDKRTCAALVSYSCLRPLPDSNTVQTSRYQMACVENAKCIFPGDKCECDFRYYEAANHTCIRQHDYGSECSADEHCDQFKFFSCIRGKCACDPNKNHKYDEKNDKCMVPVGIKWKCRTIEFQSIQEKYFKTDECPEHATCTDGRCRCNPGYRITNDRTCGRELGDACDSKDNKCSDVQFICRNQKCVCKYSSHQVSSSGTECISLVSGPCTTEKEARGFDDPHFIQNCTENAYCQESQVYNYCQCKKGYVETNEGTCVKAWGMPCETDKECDNVASLACIENKCDCPDRLTTYDDKLRRCVGLAGSRCWRDANSTAVCTSHAYCVKANSQLNWGKCTCQRNYGTTPQRTCSS